jgi:hypothetical protein
VVVISWRSEGFGLQAGRKLKQRFFRLVLRKSLV